MGLKYSPRNDISSKKKGKRGNMSLARRNLIKENIQICQQINDKEHNIKDALLLAPTPKGRRAHFEINSDTMFMFCQKYNLQKSQSREI